MRALLVMVVAYVMAGTVPCLAQGSAKNVNTQTLPGGMSIALPNAWQRVDAATEQKVNAAMDTLFPRVKDSLFQAALSRGKPVQLLIATDREHPQRTLSLNAAPAPGATAASFAAASDADFAAMLKPLCQTLGQLLTQAKSRLISCGPPERRILGNRSVALTRYVRAAPTGFVSVWLVQYPDDNVVYSLTMNALQTEESGMEPVFRGIWESLHFDGARDQASAIQ